MDFGLGSQARRMGHRGKAMNALVLRERLIILLLARDDDVSVEDAKVMWKKLKKVALKGHDGDCTNEPQPCAACFVDRMRRESKPFLKLFGRQE